MAIRRMTSAKDERHRAKDGKDLEDPLWGLVRPDGETRPGVA